MPRYSANVIRRQYAYVEFDPEDWVEGGNLDEAAQAAAYEQNDWEQDYTMVEDIVCIEED